MISADKKFVENSMVANTKPRASWVFRPHTSFPVWPKKSAERRVQYLLGSFGHAQRIPGLGLSCAYILMPILAVGNILSLTQNELICILKINFQKYSILTMGKAVGRPTIMTPQVLQKLELAFSYGCTDDEACFFADIAPTTL